MNGTTFRPMEELTAAGAVGEELGMASKAQRHGKVDLNSADLEELEQLEGIDSGRARSILEYRSKHGPFASWEAFDQVPGIGERLLAKLQATATLGGVGAAKAEAAPRGAEAAKAEGTEEETEQAEGVQLEETAEGTPEEDAELTALTALSQLDLEAAEAYQVGAHHISDRELREKLLEFRADHLRHVRDLEALIKARGGEPLDQQAANQSVLTGLAEAAGELGPAAALLAMVANERLTNATYDSLLALEWDDDVLRVLERNCDDEHRHLRWLEEHQSQVMPEEERPGAPA
jgi:competence ComEA-like helix-hairpin-helix protein